MKRQRSRKQIESLERTHHVARSRAKKGERVEAPVDAPVDA